MKKVLVVLFLLLLSAYLVAAVTVFNKPDTNEVCKDVIVCVEDSARAGFIRTGQIRQALQKSGLYPEGKLMIYVNSDKIEQFLRRMALLEEVNCYKTVDGKVRISVTQRLPVMRIMSENGDDYYLDARGRIMPPTESAADLVVATGRISRPFARKYLPRIGVFLQNAPFWNSQITQINVTPQQELELVPRVGDNIIFLGDPVNTMEKLNRLDLFYKKVISVVGWGKYARIDLEYPNQIICTKKDTAYGSEQ